MSLLSESESNAQVQEAARLVRKADKRLSGWSFFGNKHEEAMELYKRAGNLFKMHKQWSDAGDAFCKASNCAIQLDDKHDAACTAIDAARCFKNTSSSIDAIANLSKASDLFSELGRFSQAAKMENEIGDLLESESETTRAIEHYQKASDWYHGEDALPSACACLVKVAHLVSTTEDYRRAIELYEKVAKQSLDNPLLKWSAKDYLFRAALCRLVQVASEQLPLESARSIFQLYEDMDLQFSGSREAMLVTRVLNAFATHDLDSFSAAVVEFDSVQKLDGWKTDILLKIKRRLEHAPNFL
jgi:alpha-soluble NSF attachment protein